MIVLGLGTNLNDRLANLRLGLQLIKKIQDLSIREVSPVYLSNALLPDNAPSSWDQPYLNLAIRCDTTLSPHELLYQTKEIELKLGRSREKIWGPRPLDIDILAWDDLVLYDDRLHIPHKDLHERPFALWPLADVAPRWVYPIEGACQGKTASEICAAWGSRLTGEAPLETKQIQQRIDIPQLVGILNITPDSFSDGGKLSDVTTAIQYAHQLMLDGAEIIDIGAEATGPKAIALDSTLEWQRLEPVLTGIIAEKNNMLISPKISVDTRHPDVAIKALDLGVDWINDITGLSDPAMREIILARSCDVVIMHQLGIPTDQNLTLPADKNPCVIVYDWAEKQLDQLEKIGIPRDRIILDVGIGYGKTAAQSLELIQHIHEFHRLGTRLLVGHSRKSFLKLFTSQSAEARDIETLPISLYLSEKNIDYIRIHNIEMCARAFKVQKTLTT